MKKIFLTGLMCLLCWNNLGYAEEIDHKQETLNWEISMMPKPSEAEQQAARWSIVTENKMGIYAYDIDSFVFSKITNGIVDKNIISVLTKTVFTDKEILKNLDNKYRNVLAKKEKSQYCEILMTFNLVDKTYGITKMNVYGSKNTLLQQTERELSFQAVPKGSFAELMLEICQQAVTNSK